MYKLSNGLFPEVLNDVYVKKNDIQLGIVINIIFRQVFIFSYVSTRILNVITINTK